MRLVRTSAILLLVCLRAQAAPLVDRVLTLEDSVRLAMNNSPSLLGAREDVNIALQRVRQAQSLFFPRLDLNANWSKFNVEDGTPMMLQPALGTTLVPADPHENFYTARANIYQSVYEGGRSKNLWRQARISYERARSANEALQTQVAASGKQAFYDLLFAREKSRFLHELLKKHEGVISRASGSLADRLRLESELASVREQTSETTQAEQVARRAYLQALNLELNTTVELRGGLETHAVTLELPKLLAWSMQYRSELRQTEYQQELDALGVGLSLAERRPTVAFGASYERTGHDIELPVENWAGTLNVNLPVSISDIVYGWAKVRERKAQYRQATLRHSEATDQVQLQVREAHERYQFWQGELAPRKDSLRRMEALLSEMARGQVRSVDRVESERLIVAARIRYLEAVHGHLSAIATLEKAVGKTLSEER